MVNVAYSNDRHPTGVLKQGATHPRVIIRFLYGFPTNLPISDKTGNISPLSPLPSAKSPNRFPIGFTDWFLHCLLFHVPDREASRPCSLCASAPNSNRSDSDGKRDRCRSLLLARQNLPFELFIEHTIRVLFVCRPYGIRSCGFFFVTSVV